MKKAPRLLGTSLTLLTLSVSCSNSPWQGPQNLACSLGNWFKIRGPMEPHPRLEEKVRLAAQARRQAMREELRRIQDEGVVTQPQINMVTQAVQELPSTIRSHLSPAFWEELQSWSGQEENFPSFDYVLGQLENDPFCMPVIPDLPSRFVYTSPYDESQEIGRAHV